MSDKEDVKLLKSFSAAYSTLSDGRTPHDVTRMDFDTLTRHLGQVGRRQTLLYGIIGLLCLPITFNNMGIVFIAGVPEHWCSSPDLDHLNLTATVERNVTAAQSCSRLAANYSTWTAADVTDALSGGRENGSREACPYGFTYDTSVYTETIVSKWDLVCDDKWLQATAASVYMAGLMCGVLIIGSVSDLTGRRPVAITSVVACIALSFAVSFSPNYIAFCALRFFAGFFSIAVYTTGFVMAMELIGPDYRVLLGIGFQYFWTFGYMVMAGLAYGVRDWSKLNLVASALLTPLLLAVFFLPESPRWLYLNGRRERADHIIRDIAKANKVTLPDKLEIIVKDSPKAYVWDVFSKPRMAIRTLNIFFNWFVNSCVYYGLSLNTSNLGGNDFINFTLGGAVELPSYVICLLAVHYGGRRWPLCINMVIAGVALLSILAVPADMNWLVISLAMLGKLCIAASFAIIYVFTAELYPTVVRNAAVGAGSCFARIGGVVAPYIAQLSDFSKILPMIVFGALSLAAGLLILILPETKGRNLPETLEDGENFGRTPDVTTKPGSDNPAYIADEELKPVDGDCS